nr:Sua5/YciO/YrdC/YwlC family protein [Marinibactrum halimedae]
MMAGGVIAYPTEAVWGLGCDPYDAHAVGDILRLKSRPVEKGVILVAGSMDQMSPFLEGLSPSQLDTLEATWPGPHTWVIPRNRWVPYWISGQHDSVAVRVSAHPVVRALCDQFGGPIVSTSANPAGMREARTPWMVKRYFGRDVYVTPGVVGASAKPSTISDLVSGRVLRS